MYLSIVVKSLPNGGHHHDHEHDHSHDEGGHDHSHDHGHGGHGHGHGEEHCEKEQVVELADIIKSLGIKVFR